MVFLFDTVLQLSRHFHLSDRKHIFSFRLTVHQIPLLTLYPQEEIKLVFIRRLVEFHAVLHRIGDLRIGGHHDDGALAVGIALELFQHLRDIAYNALQVRDKLVSKDNKEPSISQIAKELEMPKEEVVFALDAIQDPISLFEPIYHDGGDAIFVMDQISDSKNLDEGWLENISIKEGMKKLTDREKLILNLRFFQGRTQMEVADEIGISQAQVSRLEKTALKHMRKHV